MSGDFGTHWDIFSFVSTLLVSADHMMGDAYTGAGMMVFARQMDEEGKIAWYGGILLYSVDRANRILLIYCFQVRSLSVSAKVSLVLLKVSSCWKEVFPCQYCLFWGQALGFSVDNLDLIDWGKLKLCIETLNSLLCSSIFSFFQQKDDLNGGLKQMENWWASPTWAVMQSLASVCHMSSIIGSCFIYYSVAFLMCNGLKGCYTLLMSNKVSKRVYVYVCVCGCVCVSVRTKLKVSAWSTAQTSSPIKFGLHQNCF